MDNGCIVFLVFLVFLVIATVSAEMEEAVARSAIRFSSIVIGLLPSPRRVGVGICVLRFF